jgi:hypothetical protein
MTHLETHSPMPLEMNTIMGCVLYDSSRNTLSNALKMNTGAELDRRREWVYLPYVSLCKFCWTRTACVTSFLESD